MTLRVTVVDVETGDTETATVVDGDFLLVCAEPCHLAHTAVYPGKGTCVLTVKDCKPKGDGR